MSQKYPSSSRLHPLTHGTTTDNSNNKDNGGDDDDVYAFVCEEQRTRPEFQASADERWLWGCINRSYCKDSRHYH